MPPLRLSALALLLLLVCGLMLTRAEAQAEGKDKEKPKEVKPDDAKLDLKADSIIAVYKNVADALKAMPDAILLTPEKYQAMLAEMARLRTLVANRKLRSPSNCTIKGKIVNNLAQLTAQFEFETEKSDDAVRLACTQARATAVTLDGRTPRLRHGRSLEPSKEEVGFFVEVDKPGVSTLTLELLLPVSVTGDVSSLLLDLPRAAITKIELELPAGVRDLRLDGKPGISLKGNQLSEGLGTAERLDLSWRAPSKSNVGVLHTVDGQVVVKLNEREVMSSARLTLSVIGGRTQVWKLIVPPKAEVKVVSENSKVKRIDSAEQKPYSLRTIHLEEETAEPVVVEVTHQQPMPKTGTGKAAAVGPFSVPEAIRQSGSVLVSNNVGDLHAEFLPSGDLTRRAITEEELGKDPSLIAAFRYGALVDPKVKPAAADKKQPNPRMSWLDIELESVRGQVKVRPTHQLSLLNVDGNWLWRMQSTLTVTPRWADLDRLKVRIPEGWKFNPQSSDPLPDRVRSMNYDAKAGEGKGGTVEFRLQRGAMDVVTFPLRIEADLVLTAEESKLAKATLRLPKVEGATEQDGQLTVTVPKELELVHETSQSNDFLLLEPLKQSTHEMRWRSPRNMPEAITVSWLPWRAPVEVTTIADLSILPGEVRVRQELRYLAAGSGVQLPSPLTLRVPASVEASFKLIEGGSLVSWRGSERAEEKIATIAISNTSMASLVVAFNIPLTEVQPMQLPLVVPEQATRGEARVRLWSESNLVPVVNAAGTENALIRSPAKGWLEQPLEVVPGRDRLPLLVLRSDKPHQPLIMRLAHAATMGGNVSPIIERALARVEIADDRTQTWRISYRIIGPTSSHLDVELPGTAATINLQARLDSMQIEPLVQGDGMSGMRGRVVRLRLARTVMKPMTLELSYRLDPDRIRSSTLTTPLPTPRFLLGEAESASTLTFPMRWQITTPNSWVVLSPESSLGTPTRWTRRGPFLALEPALSSGDLERWFGAGEAAGEELPPSLILWHDGQEPLELLHVQSRFWLVGCSLLVALTGFMSWRWLLLTKGESESENQPKKKESLRPWLIGLVAAGGVLAILLFRPGLVAQFAYGCQPGVLVLIVLVVFRWLWERQRRQIVFLPGFSRPSRGGSSLARHGSSNKPAEPSAPGQQQPAPLASTVDNPRDWPAR